MLSYVSEEEDVFHTPLSSPSGFSHSVCSSTPSQPSPPTQPCSPAHRWAESSHREVYLKSDQVFESLIPSGTTKLAFEESILM